MSAALAPAWHELHLELKRVQTFIFQVPKLKAMVGANALIGSTLRHDLTQTLLDFRARHPFTAPPPLLHPPPLSASPADDPLHEQDIEERDDPHHWFKVGILARDGGHFVALFNDADEALAFLDEARRLIGEKLPGVRLEAKLNGIKCRDSKDLEQALLELPVLQVCQVSGRSVATSVYRSGDDQSYVSHTAKTLLDAGKNQNNANPHTQYYDIVSLMDGFQDKRWKEAAELEDLAPTGYLALIHADGNGIGKLSQASLGQPHQTTSAEDKLYQDLGREAFFHHMRVTVRRALKQALTEAFAEVGEGECQPYRILMLGGDDLLMLCRAELALPFAAAYGKALAQLQAAGQAGLTMAIGVAIARYSYPMHRLHDLAEALAESAKQRYRKDPDCGSVVDWQVVTQSWFDDLKAARQRDALVSYQVPDESRPAVEHLLLSRRPYSVCGLQGLTELLERASKADALMTAAKSAEGAATLAARPGVGRSALRGLRAAFQTGRRGAEAAFQRLDFDLRQALCPSDQVWQILPLPGGAGTDARVLLTDVLDTIEISEIKRLGNNAKRAASDMGQEVQQ